MTILFIVLAALIGAAIAFFVPKLFHEKSHSSISRKVLEEYEQKLKDCELKANSTKDECYALVNKANEAKDKYASLLAEANVKIEELDKQLSEAFSGHIDEAIQEKLASVEKLKKKVRDLQDEADENEELVSDLQKKLKKREEDNDDLQNEVSKISREKNRMMDDLQVATENLENKTKELDLKIQTLLFVQEILQAQPADSKDAPTKDLYQQVDTLHDYILGDVKDCVKRSGMIDDTAEKKLFKDELEHWAITAKKSWIAGKTSIAFVGEFSAGKTSIVNRILSQDDPDVPRLPVSTKATTAIPTYISGSVGTTYQFVTRDNLLKNISADTFRRVNKEVLDQMQGVSSLIKYFVMKYKNPYLDKLSILDTPGFSSNDPEDAERTIKVINECDALFWVFDINNGEVNSSSLALMKEHLKKPLYIIINKIDTKSEREINVVEKRIQDTINRVGVPIKGILRFSHKAPLTDMMNLIGSITKDSNADEYVDVLKSYLQSLRDNWQKKYSELNKQYIDLVNQNNNLKNAYLSATKALECDLDTGLTIPQYSSHWYKKDNYEMSQQDYARLKSLIENVKGTKLSKIKNMYNQQMDTVEQMTAKWNEKNNTESIWRQCCTCVDKINELSNKINK